MESVYASFDKPNQLISFKYPLITTAPITSDAAITAGTLAATTSLSAPSIATDVVSVSNALSTLNLTASTGSIQSANVTTANIGSLTSTIIQATNVTIDSLNVTHALVDLATVSASHFIGSDPLVLQSTNPTMMQFDAQSNAAIEFTSNNNPLLTLDNTGNGTLSGNMVLNGTLLQLGSLVAGKDVDSGKIAYHGFSSDALDIVGAGVQAGYRLIRFYDNIASTNATFTGDMSAKTLTLNARPVMLKDGLPVGDVDVKLYLCDSGNGSTAGTIGATQGGTAPLGNMDITTSFTSFRMPNDGTNSVHYLAPPSGVVNGEWRNSFKLFNTATQLYETRSIRYNLYANYDHPYNFMTLEWSDEIKVPFLQRAILQVNFKCDDDGCLYINGNIVQRQMANSAQFFTSYVPVQAKMDFMIMVINRDGSSSYTAMDAFIEYKVVASY